MNDCALVQLLTRPSSVGGLSAFIPSRLSERIADVVDPDVKYGGGPTEIREFLIGLSGRLAQREAVEAEAVSLERDLASVRRQVEDLSRDAGQATVSLQDVEKSEDRVAALKSEATARKAELGEVLKSLLAAVKMWRKEHS